jgi:hypothetical protein
MIVPTYEVRAFPTGQLLHTAPSYELADNWRLRFHQAASVIPHWVVPQERPSREPSLERGSTWVQR